jgi:ABC-type glutathione transport system ATPase component
VLSRLRHENGLTLVIISHDLEHADRVADRVIRLAGGRIDADGPIESLPGVVAR